MSLGYLMLAWILTSWFMFCCQFMGRKHQFSIWTAKYFLKISVTGKVTGTHGAEAIFPSYQGELSSLRVYTNKNTSLMCAILIHCTPELS